ncbi:MAG TPA: glycosyltransferase family 1 protein [Thermoplasmata archaeon]|nr:glycosyltransferase family 1 protein [Thermoplasmata archaeon]
MTLEVQYPIFGRRSGGVDVRAKWFSGWYEEIRRRIPTRFVRLFYLPTSRATHGIYRQQLRLLERPNAVTHIISNMQSFLLRKRHRCPTVITCFDLSVPWTMERLPLADRVIVTAQTLRSELEGMVRLEHDPEVVYLAVPSTYRPRDVPRVANQLLYVGTELPRKNAEGLLRIVARVARARPVTLMKVGASSASRPRLLALARELGIADRVRWRDFVSEPELIELYQTSCVTLVPSFIEGFSMPCLEAMSCGCPLVASSRSVLPEIVGSGGELVDPTDEDGWAETILRVLDDPHQASRLSRGGQERAKFFSASRSADQVVRVYEEVSGAVARS